VFFSFLSDFNNLGGSDHRILPGDGFSSGGFVVVTAVVAVGVPMLRAEEVAAPASESGESNLPPATGAAVDDAFGLGRRVLVGGGRICSRRRLFGEGSLLRTRGSNGSSGGRGDSGRGGG